MLTFISIEMINIKQKELKFSQSINNAEEIKFCYWKKKKNY